MAANKNVFISYQADRDKRRIVTRVKPIEDTFFVINDEGEEERNSKPNTVFISANRHGCAFLASLITDFLLTCTPWETRYKITAKDGMSEDSPALVLAFDPSLDE